MEALSRIEVELRDAVPQDGAGLFMARIKGAVQEYYSQPDRVVVAREIRELYEATRLFLQGRPVTSPGADLPTLLSSLSDGAREIAEQFRPLPQADQLLSSDASVRKSSAEQITMSLVSGGCVRQTGKKRPQNRWHTELRAQVGPGGQGRPAEAVLVSSIAYAYSIATGKVPSRSWSDGDGRDGSWTPFESLVEEILVAIAIDDLVNSKELVRRHLEEKAEASAAEGVPEYMWCGQCQWHGPAGEVINGPDLLDETCPTCGSDDLWAPTMSAEDQSLLAALDEVTASETASVAARAGMGSGKRRVQQVRKRLGELMVEGSVANHVEPDAHNKNEMRRERGAWVRTARGTKELEAAERGLARARRMWASPMPPP
ncbi:hypothetical protein SAE02_62820 [Skermanella aerolata]|uniref:Uncharacterized protein n=2 Tax=Skermanella aerolata TaxID=393310 RepID=A0A512E087_9PROT|nr:hypothetical protein SAE02_62820 [Skermanella aerolata]